MSAYAVQRRIQITECHGKGVDRVLNGFRKRSLVKKKKYLRHPWLALHNFFRLCRNIPLIIEFSSHILLVLVILLMIEIEFHSCQMLIFKIIVSVKLSLEYVACRNDRIQLRYDCHPPGNVVGNQKTDVGTI